MQDQELTTIQLRTGVIKEDTPKAAESYWIDADKIRFRFGKPELLGGWYRPSIPTPFLESPSTILSNMLVGQPREIFAVRSLAGEQAVLVGTHVGLFSTDLDSIYDVTPVVSVISLSNSINTSAGSTRVVVSAASHGLTSDTIVVLTSATATVGGNILINTSAGVAVKYKITVIDSDAFSIDVGVTAAATSASTGGSFTVAPRINAGPSTSESFSGWGTGPWSGPFGWSTPGGSGVFKRLRQWSMDSWGTDVVAVPGPEGPLLYWSTASNITDLATIVSAAPGRSNIVRVLSDSRQVFLYGTETVSAVFDPLLIRWSNIEDFTDWLPTPENLAGDFRLNATGSRIVAVTKTNNLTLVHTDAELFGQQFVGGNDVVTFTLLGANCGVMSQNASVEYRGSVYWMGNAGQFYTYNGRVESLPCTVLRYIFDRLDPQLADKVYAAVNSKFDEIWWFYPSRDSTDQENDSYVIYNTITRDWSIGSMRRNAWIDRGTFDAPIAAGGNNVGLFYHEAGYADDGAPISATLRSAFFDLGSGDDLIFINKIVPDFIDPNGNPIQGNVNMTLTTRRYPNAPTITKGPFPVGSNTQKISMRARGREISIGIASNTINTPWRLGELRLALQPDGKR